MFDCALFNIFWCVPHMSLCSSLLLYPPGSLGSGRGSGRGGRVSWGSGRGSSGGHCRGRGWASLIIRGGSSLIFGDLSQVINTFVITFELATSKPTLASFCICMRSSNIPIPFIFLIEWCACCTGVCTSRSEVTFRDVARPDGIASIALARCGMALAHGGYMCVCRS